MTNFDGERIDGTTLDGVPVTALWTLRNRAVESARAGSDFTDPLAERLYRSISFPYENFGNPSQSHPLRATTFDNELRKFLHGTVAGSTDDTVVVDTTNDTVVSTTDDTVMDTTNSTVVALGEGMQTTYWRLGRPEVSWLSVDLPEMIAIRKRLLPTEERIRYAAMSALDRSWFDLVDTDNVIITAEGLLMYLPPEEVYALIADMAARFPGARLLFDGIPPWFVERTSKGTVKMARKATYQVPPMPFGLTVAAARRLPERIPGVAEFTELPLVGGRGLFWNRRVARALTHLPVLGNHRYFMAALTFGSH